MAAALLSAAPSEAQASWFFLELNTGVGEEAYSAGRVGIAYGATGGVTLKFKSFPVRFYLLGNVINRHSSQGGFHDGVSFSASRRDLDVYGSVRTVMPVWKMLRVYAEIGMGRRFFNQTIYRNGNLGDLSERDSALLLVTALGLQARLSSLFSVGIRGELAPLRAAPDLSTYAADLLPTQNRLSLFAQFGVHF